MKKLYRYEICSYLEGKSSVELFEFEVTRETEKSYICEELKDCGRRTSISKTSKRKYAYPDKESALESLKLRKLRQLEILSNQLRMCNLSNDFLKEKTVKSLEESNSFSNLDDLFKFLECD